eukprot:2107752-Pyramimonas_sp.AAC.1
MIVSRLPALWSTWCDDSVTPAGSVEHVVLYYVTLPLEKPALPSSTFRLFNSPKIFLLEKIVSPFAREYYIPDWLLHGNIRFEPLRLATPAGAGGRGRALCPAAAVEGHSAHYQRPQEILRPLLHSVCGRPGERCQQQCYRKTNLGGVEFSVSQRSYEGLDVRVEPYSEAALARLMLH